MSWGQWPSALVSMESPISRIRVHLRQLAGLVGWCSSSPWAPLHSRHLVVSLQCWVLWSSRQQFRHWVMGGLS